MRRGDNSYSSATLFKGRRGNRPRLDFSMGDAITSHSATYVDKNKTDPYDVSFIYPTTPSQPSSSDPLQDSTTPNEIGFIKSLTSTSRKFVERGVVGFIMFASLVAFYVAVNGNIVPQYLFLPEEGQDDYLGHTTGRNGRFFEPSSASSSGWSGGGDGHTTSTNRWSFGRATSFITGGKGVLSVSIPPGFSNVADLNEPLAPGDVPLFWHIPFSSGTSIKYLLGSCHSLVQASDLGAQKGYDRAQSLKVMQMPGDISFVNVNMYSTPGIERAKQLNLLSSELADVVVTDHLQKTMTLLTENRRGRIFTMIRNPVERIIGFFYHAREASWDQVYEPLLSQMTIEEYAGSTLLEQESNLLTKVLGNCLTCELTKNHVEIAMAVLKEKCLVGMVDQKQVSVERFEKYFGWKTTSPSQVQCKYGIFNTNEWLNQDSFESSVTENSETWNLIAAANVFDMQVYNYAEQLFRDQRSLVESVDRIH